MIRCQFTAEAATALALNVPADLIAPGTRIGKYEIVHRIAYGGMAEIYLARATGIHGFEKYLVLKRILPQYAHNEEFVRMFINEARVAATLDHANIAHVYEIGQQGSSYFFTMEYLHGEDLRFITRDLAKRQERMPLEHALAIIVGAASGLHFAHEKKSSDGRPLGLVHRDVSPSNVVVTYDGGVKLVDFGIAKMTAAPELSRNYGLKGKVAYMSPEQLRSQPVDRRSDVFALGIVLFESTTHTRLFKAPTEIESIRLVLEQPLPRPSERVPDYPAELERIVLRALDADSERRYPTARDLQLDLEAFARDQKLNLSSAALGQWMERAFGPKREIWHSLPPPAEPPAANQAPLEHGNDPTNLVSRPDVADSGAPTAGPPVRRRPWMAVAVAGVSLALGAAVALRFTHEGRLLLGASAAAPAPVLLVAEQGTVAVEPTAGGAPARAPATAPAPSGTPPPSAAPAAPPPAEPSEASPAAPRTRPHSRSTPAPRDDGAGDAFSAAFARHETKIRSCFSQHDGAGTAARAVSLRFEIGTDGRPTSVAVSPAELAATPLGACLAKVGAATRFPAQPAPIAFRIPLTVELQRLMKAHH